MRARPGTHGLPSDREGMLSLHAKHGSWSAVARALKIARATLTNHVNRVGLTGGVDHRVGQVRLSLDQQWVTDRDELCRRIQRHGNINKAAAHENISDETLRRWVVKHGLEPADWAPNPADFGVQRYDTPYTVEGDWAIASDFQAPFTSRPMVQLLCRLSKAWGIQNLLLAGDFTDLHNFSFHDPLTEQPSWSDTEVYLKNLIRVLREAFPGKIVWSLGNHEVRLPRSTKGKWSLGHLASIVEATDHDIRVAITPRVYIDTPRGKWCAVHPRSYSRVPTVVARSLAVKYRCNILCAHGHGVGYGRDASGTFECYDIGGMFDAGTLDYPNQLPTTAPEMRNAFVLLRGGYAHLVQPDSDIEWLTRAGRAKTT